MSTNERPLQDSQEHIRLVFLAPTVLARLHIRDDLLDRIVVLVRERGERVDEGDSRTLAADSGYDSMAFRGELRENGIRPLIKHRILAPFDHAHNGRMNREMYNQRWMAETVFSNIKRTLGATVHARSWWLESREMLLKATVYNLRRSVRHP